ncbi:MAG: hypothetical protein HZY75_14535 [Nocardioidaceae bacterium]|nr:MAG: hypothetical protein HZY75_14535 [Nocardioidaceae bacterium]
MEEQIGQWRAYVQRARALEPADVDELEEHLREQIADLSTGGLQDDEAFLVAVKRMGALDSISREFAREHSDRLWKQLVLVGSDDDATGRRPRELAMALALSVGAALALKAGITWLPETLAIRNSSLLVLPFLAAYFCWKRHLGIPVVATLVAVAVVVGLVLNLYPYDDAFAAESMSDVLIVLHAPVVLWFAVGIAYAGGHWRSHERRMDFVRFTGEWVVYYVLLALGGGLLMALTVGAFATLDINIERALVDWVLPWGVAGAVVVAAWLVEAKQNVVENIAPVLTRVFTPLTVLMLVAVLLAFMIAPDVIDVARELLIVMTAILVLVLGLLLYAVSAHDPLAPPGVFDWLQFALLVAALAVDAIVLVAMLGRIAEFGVSPNKVAALGLNLVILVNLVWSTVLTLRFTRGRGTFAALERWQTNYLPTYAVWAAWVVVVLPPVFGFE